MSVSTVMSHAQAAAGADASWLGSEDHLAFLADSVGSVFEVPDVMVVWGRPGESSYWETASRRIVLERPVPTPAKSPQSLAEETVLSLLHEALHARFTTPSPRFRHQLGAVYPKLRRWIEVIFNRLEDGRVAMLASEADPELGPPLEELATRAVDQFEAMAKLDGATPEPRQPRNQLVFALVAYALQPERTVTLHPAVQEELDRLKGLVDETRDGTTEDCGAAAFALVKHVSEFIPETQ